MNIQPIRGIIYDRDGKILVKNTPTFNLISIPNNIDDPELFIEDIKNFIDITGNRTKTRTAISESEVIIDCFWNGNTFNIVANFFT